MTVKEAILRSLSELKKPVTSMEVYDYITTNKYYDFNHETADRTVSSRLGEFIAKGDIRVKRTKGENGRYLYYRTENENSINIDIISQPKPKTTKKAKSKTYQERDLHKLLSSYLKSTDIFSKTILHEKSKNSKDKYQKWVHPDMIGIKFINLKREASQSLLKVANNESHFKFSSYELKKEIRNDYELKEYYFQAVSNSSWSNFGYLVALEIDDSLNEEMERLNQSFGIGIIELKSNPYESKLLYPSKFRELDFKTIDKLCNINEEFEEFIQKVENLLTADNKYIKATKEDFRRFCDPYFQNDSEIEKYCKDKNIPYNDDGENLTD